MPVPLRVVLALLPLDIVATVLGAVFWDPRVIAIGVPLAVAGAITAFVLVRLHMRRLLLGGVFVPGMPTPSAGRRDGSGAWSDDQWASTAGSAWSGSDPTHDSFAAHGGHGQHGRHSQHGHDGGHGPRESDCGPGGEPPSMHDSSCDPGSSGSWGSSSGWSDGSSSSSSSDSSSWSSSDSSSSSSSSSDSSSSSSW